MIKNTCKKLSRGQWSRIITIRYPAPNNRNGDNRSYFRSEVVFAIRDKGATSVVRKRIGLNNFRRNLHAFLLSPFKSQGDEVEQEVPSRSLRTVYLTVSCAAMVYNFLFVAKIVSRVRLDYRFASYCFRLCKKIDLISKHYRSLSFFIPCNFNKKLAIYTKFQLNVQICCIEMCVNK